MTSSRQLPTRTWLFDFSLNVQTSFRDFGLSDCFIWTGTQSDLGLLLSGTGIRTLGNWLRSSKLTTAPCHLPTPREVPEQNENAVLRKVWEMLTGAKNEYFFPLKNFNFVFKAEFKLDQHGLSQLLSRKKSTTLEDGYKVFV